jgi:hypothetical protein
MRLIELIKLIPAGLNNPKDVVEGHINNVRLSLNNLPEDEQEEIVRRRVICEGCPNMSKNKPGARDKGFDYCTLCSCPINAKTAALGAQCGAAIYNEKHSEDEQPVLWTRYKNH